MIKSNKTRSPVAPHCERPRSLENEKPKGETIAYETLLNAWKNGKVR